MSNYKISKYQKDNAKLLNVKIKPSTNPSKKIDVFKDKVKIASIGDINYDDFSTIKHKYGYWVAHERRRLYNIRHENDSNIYNSNGYWAKNIIW
jgi:hypothetical protein